MASVLVTLNTFHFVKSPLNEVWITVPGLGGEWVGVQAWMLDAIATSSKTWLSMCRNFGMSCRNGDTGLFKAW